jgi:hypothetical protein
MTATTNRPLSALFLKIAELAEAIGLRSIKSLPGCWEFQIDGTWWIAVNGHDEPMATSKGGTPVPPFMAYVEFNGWPAGLLDPYGGMLAAGTIANEAALTRAIETTITRIKTKPTWAR